MKQRLRVAVSNVAHFPGQNHSLVQEKTGESICMALLQNSP